MAVFNDFITLKEAGLISGYHPDYIGALIRANKITGKKVGRNWFVSKKEVQEYFTTQHYVPVAKFFSGWIKIVFFFSIFILLGVFVIYFFSSSNSKSAPVVVQSSLSDTVGAQQDNVAQQFIVTGK